MFSRKFWKAALIRAIRTVCQDLGSTLPVGIIITPIMIQEADWTILYVIAAWLCTGLLGGVASLLMSIATGIPEAEK